MKKILRKSERSPRKNAQKGNALIMMLITLPVIVGMAGFTLDWGRGVWVRTQLQKASDAGALAGASFIPNSSLAQQKASAVVEANFNSPDNQTYTMLSGNRYRVQLTENVPTTFMRMLGHDSIQVAASSTAVSRRPFSRLKGGGFPFAIINPNRNNDPTDDLVWSNYGRPYIIAYGEDNVMVTDWVNGSQPCPPNPSWDGNPSHGWRGGLDLKDDGTIGNAGASDIRNCMINGWPGTMSIGDIVPTQRGNITGAINQGRDGLLGSNPLDWDSFNVRLHGEISRVVLVPVVRLLHSTRNDTYTVADYNNGATWDKNVVVIDGFAPFFILKESEQRQYLGHVKNNTKDWVVGLFVPGVETKRFGFGGSAQPPDMGLYAPPRLVE